MESHLLQSLFDEEERLPWSVSELNAEIRSVLERSFGGVWVEGEITNFHAHGSGHWYFSLTDGDAFIKAACFKGQNYRIRFKPENGLQVRVRGKLSVYGPRGELQIVVESLEPVGEGALLVAFEQIKAKLLKEGLFNEALKRPIPAFPRRVGVVTSPSGAALQDILTVLDRRARSVNIVLIPTLVQGEKAGEQVAAGIAMANEFSSSASKEDRIDVLIVGRGGGSNEDLWAFNEEQVARAIRASKIPVISAVGHEVDFTIADMAADLRAPTPSAAAEIVAKAEAEVIDHLKRTSAELIRSVSLKMLTAKADVQRLTMASVFSEVPGRVRDLRYEADDLLSRASNAINMNARTKVQVYSGVAARLSPIGLSSRVSEIKRRLGLLEHRSAATASEMTRGRQIELEKGMARLDALSPLAVLTRGYSITQKQTGEIVRDSKQANIGERLNIRLSKGRLQTEVSQIEEAAD